MLLPAALDQTTLGDLLGPLHRERVYGVLELVEVGAARCHRVSLWDGLVAGVVLASGETPPIGQVLRRHCGDPLLAGAIARASSRVRDPRPLGERLVAAGVISRAQLDAALVEAHRERLDWLDRLSHANLRFRPLRTPPQYGVPLGPHAFLHGRRRSRGISSLRSSVTEQARDYATLGLPEDSSFEDVKRAFRLAVLRHHPDRYVHLGTQAQAQAQANLRRILESYERIRCRSETAMVA